MFVNISVSYEQNNDNISESLYLIHLDEVPKQIDTSSPIECATACGQSYNSFRSRTNSNYVPLI